MRMFAQELLTGQINRDWVKDLKLIINKINEKYGHQPYDDEELTKNMVHHQQKTKNDSVRDEGKGCAR